MQEVSCFSLTTDLWTSASHDPYLSLTMHYIDKQWNLKSINLETTPMFDDHTGVNLYEALNDILENWNLPLEKLACVTTDNGLISLLLSLIKMYCNCHALVIVWTLLSLKDCS